MTNIDRRYSNDARSCVPSRQLRRRLGMTLTELLVVMTILSIVMIALVDTLQRQQRFYRSEADIINTRKQVRQAIDLIPGDLRELSTSSTGAHNDIYSMSDSALDMRQTFGSSIICQILDSLHVALPPRTLVKQNALTAWLRSPIVGDSMWIFDDSAGTGSRGMWHAYHVSGITTSAGGCPPSSNYTQAGDSTRSSYAITLSPQLTKTTIVGAPIRFFARVHYALYQASNGRFYLGDFNCNDQWKPPTYCAEIAAVAGPYVRYSTSTDTSGFALQYYDSLGNVTSIARNVARIRIGVRARTQLPVALTGIVGNRDRDSLRVDVAVRNRY